MASVWISRLRVTGGFLADLDVAFEPGLNVIIGPRGVGKTTLLELIRHALGTAHADRSRSAREEQRVRSLLADGEVVLDLEDDNSSRRLVVDAEGGGRRPELVQLALMLGQNELEAIASDPESRLRLIDLRAKLGRPDGASTDAGSLTRQLAGMRAAIEDLVDEGRQRDLLMADLEALTAEEASLLAHASAEMQTKRETLRDLENELLRLQAESAQVAAAHSAGTQLYVVADELGDRIVEMLALQTPIGVAEEVGAKLAALTTLSDQIRAQAYELVDVLEGSERGRSQRELELRALAEPIRSELNDSERGLGELTARVRNIRAQISRLDASQRRLQDLRSRSVSVQAARDELLDAAEASSESRYTARLSIAEQVSRHLGARVTITVEHLADSTAFQKFLLAALQGSGLKYAAIAEAFSRRLLPRQLLELVESRDAVSAAAATEVQVDRAARAIEHLDQPDVLAELAMIQLDDRADFQLVDGAVMKSVDSLSTGQKCAVTLPILLTEHARALILDQPEDHLDNAYLVDNIVVGLNNRSAAKAQTIVATHNANIPVLGSANKVVLLKSDGRRGYVSKSGRYDHPEIVSAITTLMEGGEDAFRRRAEFYRRHGMST